ncbi:GNAT family N-acetyltransferase [Pengzhenrongella frigida]|uniref:GNAT family N-acetyltransferase n=1 Tax=Pengzhenrongella frigida TaxID=1259133 RepID=A0A4Q5MYW9_9MICO|nr:GNAT family N-acetyltransferase [Cellulomonas sp. HLT2-17]RYV50905.1 GNAT family N-acetyltransferase [Cellulomonas sp. HLT2-17]
MRPTRLITAHDVPALTALVRTNRDFLAPWEPVRNEEYFTEDGQSAVVDAALAMHRQEAGLPHVILDEAGRIVGRITLSGVVRGAFQSCCLGYWVAEVDNGRGHATAAVRDITRVAFEDWVLHRVQAEILHHNLGSRRVLERTGFAWYGTAPEYLNIAGSWQDFDLYQVLDGVRAV